MGKSCEQDSSNMLDLKYYCVATLEYDWLLKAMRNVWSVVPVTWLSSKKEFLVYPNPTYKAGEKLPCDWKPKIYKRHAHPQTSWLEYDIVAILNLDKPVRHAIAVKAAKAAANGSSQVANILQSDSEKSFGRNKRAPKPTKVFDPSQPTNGEEKNLMEDDEQRVSKNTRKPLEATNGTAADAQHTELGQGSNTTNEVPMAIQEDTNSLANPAIIQRGLNLEQTNDNADVNFTDSTLLPVVPPANGILDTANWRAVENSTSGEPDDHFIANIQNESFEGEALQNAVSGTAQPHHLQTFDPHQYQRHQRNNNWMQKHTDVMHFSEDVWQDMDSGTGSSLSGHGDFYVDTNSTKKMLTIMDMMFEMHQNSQSFQSLLENKLNYIIDKMDNLSAHDVAARIQDQAEYHDDVVKAQFPELPYNSVQTLTTVNTSLADKNLAVSLVGFLYNTYKSEADVKKFVNRMYITIFGDSASQKLQWRSAPKTNDKR
ncbi:uncharacterized protein LOC116916874 isoform X1 [Daphnia magna]|uniref:uncharacterized protein LOC116916874 isoform X1 n=1 Tax=Daphnia magna TaxID=35525 RepID=UPI001E1BCDF9|nr:uncharacterized protein LOC116916874 isoform X1 [Daphnia magna]